jgi:excisionase family DNA binding protein
MNLNRPAFNRSEVPFQWRLLTKQELAATAGVSERTIDNWMARRLIRYHKLGRVVRFNIEHVREDLKNFQVVAVNLQ